MSICMVKGKRAWYKIEAVMKDGSRRVIDRIDLVPPPQGLGDRYIYYIKGVEYELSGYQELDLYVESICDDPKCTDPDCAAEREREAARKKCGLVVLPGQKGEQNWWGKLKRHFGKKS